MFRLLNRCSSCENLEIKNKIPIIKCFVCFRKKSYYEVLGLNSTASSKDIKSAYYKLSLQFHPDKNSGSSESIAKFREISEAYEILGNPEKRKMYDDKGIFQNQYPRNESYNQHYYRPRSYRGPYTGKTRDFDYDEHYRQHYETFEKMRRSEYEYFRRRWEADYRRYRNFDDFDNKTFKNQEAYEEVKQRFSRKRRTYFFLFLSWLFLTFIHYHKELFNPDNRVRQRVYYEVSDVNDKEGKD